ncbi:MAG: serine/threonine protein kinase [bacterium]|nr:serine/threonine protein kinase [bacterium]
MTPDRWQTVKDVFHAALERGPEERTAFVDDACGGDSELRAEVTRLLDRHNSQDGFLETLPRLSEAVGEPGSGLACPGRIGAYALLSVLGEGGMGTVYLARQEKPHREVALKVIRARFLLPKLLRRFEHEAEMLGRLQHPGIAQIFEAGAYQIGGDKLPFFAMELVHGHALIRYTELHHLSTGARLELLARVCDAVQHAHQKGIVHRDLKPANVLVDASGQPKVLDFGVARATDIDIQMTTQRTDVGQLVGTIPYMSPEQVSGDPDDLDTRSDVYTLGVTGYELLAGRLPYDVTRRTVPESIRVIREEEATPLSSVNRVFRGDLDTIFAKALEKDKERRYQTASDLAADIRRYLHDEPIVARRPSSAYQLRKFAWRNRALVGGGSVAAIAVLAALVLTGLALVHAKRSERLASDRLAEVQSEASKALAVKDFLEELLSAADPFAGRGREVTVLEALDQAARRLDVELADQPEVRAAVQHTIGVTYHALGQNQQAEPHLRAALKTRRGLFGAVHPEVADSMNALGALLVHRGEHAEAEPLIREAGDARRSLLGSDNALVARTLANLGMLKREVGDYEAANAAYEEAVSIYRRAGPARALDLALCLTGYANLMREANSLSQAESMCEEALEIRRDLLGEDHPYVVVTLEALATTKHAQGDFAAAEALYADVVTLNRKLLGDDHPRVVVALSNLAMALKAQGRHEDAVPIYRDALRIQRKLDAPDHPRVGVLLNNLANALNELGAYREAEPLYREALDILRKRFGQEHPYVAQTLVNLGTVLDAAGDPQSAEVVLREAYELAQKLFGPEHPVVGQVMMNLGCVQGELGDYDQAEPTLRRAVEVLSSAVGPRHPSTAEAQYNLGLVLAQRGEYQAAEQLFREALPLQKESLGESHPALALTLLGLSDSLMNNGALGEAEAAVREALAICRQTLPEEHPTAAEAHRLLAKSLIAQQRYEEAAELLTARHQSLVGELGDEAEAVREAARLLVALYENWGKPDEVARWEAYLRAAEQHLTDAPTEAGNQQADGRR